MPKTLYMETTQIAAAKTCGEIIQVLVEAGARQIATEYSESGAVTGLTWAFLINERPAIFAMPARIEPVYKRLRSRRKGNLSLVADRGIREQAERVAWRQLLRWVQAQASMIETGMVEPGEVFAPFLLDTEGGRTLWQSLTESRFKMLAAPKEGLK